MKYYKLVVAGMSASVLVLAACNDGGSSTTATTTTSTAASSTFPTGLAIAAPTELTAATNVAAIKFSTRTYLADLGKDIYAAMRQGQWSKAAELVASVLPISSAYAAPTKTSEYLRVAQAVEKILDGTRDPSTSGDISFAEFLAQDTNDNCFAPQVAYDTHEDGTPSSGNLPTGDNGIWKSTAADGQPCTVAQLQRRVQGVKGRMNQGLIMAAWMRDALSDSGTAMPAAGASTALTTAFNTRVQAVDATVTISSATIALNSAGTIYTYRIVATKGSDKVEVKMQHTPTSTTVYSGVMTVTKLGLSTDGAFGCNDQKSGSDYLVATVNTVRYSRSGDTMSFGSRSGQYCGAESSGSTDFASDVASFDANGALDPSVHLTGSSTRGATKGWRGNFARFSGSFDRTTFAGDFLYAWQAGNLDGKSRTFAAHTDYSTTTEIRTAKGFFAYSDSIELTDGSLLGMICNWAGPNNSHTPTLKYQYQAASLAPSGAIWSSTADNIVFAPTNSCNSTSTQFDADGDGVLTAGEGAPTTNSLAVASGTVQATIEAAGFSKASMAFF